MKLGYRWLTGVLDHWLRLVAVIALFGTPLVILAVHHGHHLWLVAVSVGAVLLLALAEGAYATWDEAERRIPVATAEPDIQGKLLRAWEDKEFKSDEWVKFGAEIETINREPDRMSVRYALIFYGPTMHSEEEQDEPPLIVEGRTTSRDMLTFYFPEMFVGPFRHEDGPPHARSMKLALRELISETEKIEDVRP